MITVAASLTFVFGEPLNPHFVFLLVFLLVLTFLMIEARRYCYYALWAYRVKLMETNFLTAILKPALRPRFDWADQLTDSLDRPRFPLSRWEAVGRRFRRSYFWLTSLLLVSWLLKLIVHPTQADSLSQVIERAQIGLVPGDWVMIFVGVVYVSLLLFLVSLPEGWRESLPCLLRWLRRRLVRVPRLLPKDLTRERLATIVTAEKQAIAGQVLEELGRGVTALDGTGMYTGQQRCVLLCVVADVEVSFLREVVHHADPEAFVVVSPTAEVRGGGFQPFEPPS